jgi:hypothetical protein
VANGTPIAGRIRGHEGKYVMVRMNMENRQRLETWDSLTEDEFRELLRDNGETELQIENRIAATQANLP